VEPHPATRGPFNTLFTAFNVMLGMGDSPVDSGFDETYRASGGDPAFVKWVYILYVDQRGSSIYPLSFCAASVIPALPNL